MTCNQPIIAILESNKPYDNRIPIHPDHFPLIDKENVILQNDYAQLFGQSNASLRLAGFDLLPRNTLLQQADTLCILKPTPQDLIKMKPGSTLIGWCHAVQQQKITEIAIQKKLTLIAMEEMFFETAGQKKHVFYENNFVAGYVGVEHALESTPVQYSKNAKIAIITFGTVSHGALSRLKEMGYSNITVFSRRTLSLDSNFKHNITYQKIIPLKNTFITTDGQPFQKLLSQFDIIINGIMQDPLNPYIFLEKKDLCSLHNKLIIDISCDNGMGFEFAQPTNLNNPIIKLPNNNYYYAVENIPAINWKTTTLSISEQIRKLITFIPKHTYCNKIDLCIENATIIKSGIVYDYKLSQFMNN